MKIGIISDIHGNACALKAVLQELGGKCNRLLCLGDITGYYPFVNEVFDLIRDFDVGCIGGNHDYALISGVPVRDNRVAYQSFDYVRREILSTNFDFLQQLTYRNSMVVDGVRILMAHGSPRCPINEYVYPDNFSANQFLNVDADFVLIGHTHIPMIKEINTVLVVNPGSCGQPRDGNPLASYAIIDTKSRNVIFGRKEYNILRVALACRVCRIDPILVDILYHGGRWKNGYLCK